MWRGTPLISVSFHTVWSVRTAQLPSAALSANLISRRYSHITPNLLSDIINSLNRPFNIPTALSIPSLPELAIHSHSCHIIGTESFQRDTRLAFKPWPASADTDAAFPGPRHLYARGCWQVLFYILRCTWWCLVNDTSCVVLGPLWLFNIHLAFFLIKHISAILFIVN